MDTLKSKIHPLLAVLYLYVKLLMHIYTGGGGVAPSANDEGAKGPQNGPKGPGGLKGPPALCSLHTLFIQDSIQGRRERGPKAPPALCKSKKEGSRRPPKPSCNYI